METLVIFLVSLLIGTVALKGSIRMVDGYNHKNTWGTAFGWTLLFAVMSIPTPFPFSILLLVAWATILLQYYEITVLRTLGVIVAQVVLGVGMAFGAGLVLGALGVA